MPNALWMTVKMMITRAGCRTGRPSWTGSTAGRPAPPAAAVLASRKNTRIQPGPCTRPMPSAYALSTDSTTREHRHRAADEHAVEQLAGRSRPGPRSPSRPSQVERPAAALSGPCRRVLRGRLDRVERDDAANGSSMTTAEHDAAPRQRRAYAAPGGLGAVRLTRRVMHRPPRARCGSAAAGRRAVSATMISGQHGRDRRAVADLGLLEEVLVGEVGRHQSSRRPARPWSGRRSAPKIFSAAIVQVSSTT